MKQTLSQAITKLINATPAQIAKVARDGHAQIMAADPKPTSFVRHVDGVRDASEDLVRSDGIIVYHYSRLEPIIDYALQCLRELSPVKTGAYRDSHVWVIANQQVADASSAEAGQPVFLLSPLIYSRKIEIGKMKMRVPGTDRVYDQAVIKVRRRFGNQAWIDLAYQSPHLDYVALGGRRGGRKASPEKRAAHNFETATRVPALRIRLM